MYCRQQRNWCLRLSGLAGIFMCPYADAYVELLNVTFGNMAARILTTLLEGMRRCYKILRFFFLPHHDGRVWACGVLCYRDLRFSSGASGSVGRCCWGTLADCMHKLRTRRNETRNRSKQQYRFPMCIYFLLQTPQCKFQIASIVRSLPWLPSCVRTRWQYSFL